MKNENFENPHEISSEVIQINDKDTYLDTIFHALPESGNEIVVFVKKFFLSERYFNILLPILVISVKTEITYPIY